MINVWSPSSVFFPRIRKSSKITLHFSVSWNISVMALSKDPWAYIRPNGNLSNLNLERHVTRSSKPITRPIWSGRTPTYQTFASDFCGYLFHRFRGAMLSFNRFIHINRIRADTNISRCGFRTTKIGLTHLMGCSIVAMLILPSNKVHSWLCLLTWFHGLNS